jgi:hypothetical protein
LEFNISVFTWPDKEGGANAAASIISAAAQLFTERNTGTGNGSTTSPVFSFTWSPFANPVGRKVQPVGQEYHHLGIARIKGQ